MPAFVARHGAVGYAIKLMACKDHVRAKTMWPVQDLRLRVKGSHAVIQAVYHFPHLTGNAVANRARILADPDQARDDGVWIILAKREKFKYVMRSRLRIKFVK